MVKVGRRAWSSSLEIYPCVCVCYLSLNSILVISCIAIIIHTYMLDIFYVLTLVLYQESY